MSNIEGKSYSVEDLERTLKQVQEQNESLHRMNKDLRDKLDQLRDDFIRTVLVLVKNCS